jgi:predicted component of type VI protein secretion system
MLANRMGAYLPPVQAIQEAFADIQAHELGMLAGIAASLTDQLAQLDPEDIAQTAEAPAALNRMLRNPKVAAWDLFVARHAALRTGLDESAGALSSDAFRRAYQAQVDGHLSVKANDYRAAK